MAKHLSIFLVDVGPPMHNSGDLLGEALRRAILAKIINKPRDECALVLYGSSETDNPVHTEMANDGQTDQFLNIQVTQPLQPPTTAFLKALYDLPKGEGQSDFVNAITVAADIINQAIRARPELEKANVAKEIVICSNFLERIGDEDLDSFLEELVNILQAKGVALNIIFLDDPDHDAEQPGKEFNERVLSRLTEQVPGRATHVHTASELLGAFRCREYSSTAYYSGPFSIGNMMNICVKVAKKAKRETMPATALYSTLAQTENASHEVSREREYKDASDPDAIVVPEERAKSYKYGRDFVPVSFEDERYLAYKPERGIQLMGFWEEVMVPLHQQMKDPWIMVAEKGNQRSGKALSALVRAMERKKQAAVLLFVPRVSEAAGANAAAKSGQPDCLVLSHLPFAEDVRAARFAAFDERPDLMPSAEQREQMARLVKDLDLADGAEQLAPERTANPAIHRFYACAAAKAAGRDGDGAALLPLPAADPMVLGTLEARPALLARAADALAALPQAISVKEQKEQPPLGLEPAKEENGEGSLLKGEAAEEAPFMLEAQQAASNVQDVGTSDPVGDFVSLLGRGRLDAAFRGMQAKITELVDSSMGSRNYGKAASAVAALREQAVKHSRGAAFNEYLHQLAGLFEGHAAHAGFWRMLMEGTSGQQVRLIDDEEDPGSGTSAAEAAGFFARHSGAPKVEIVVEPAKMEVDVADEYADME